MWKNNSRENENCKFDCTWKLCRAQQIAGTVPDVHVTCTQRCFKVQEVKGTQTNEKTFK